MTRSRIAALLLAGMLALTACTTQEVPAPRDIPTVAPLESPNAQGTVETLPAFRDAVPELADLPLESIQDLTVQRNDRQWVLGASNEAGEASMLRSTIMSEFGEFPEVDLATTTDGTVYQTVIAPEGRAMELTLNDMGDGAFLFSVLLDDADPMAR